MKDLESIEKYITQTYVKLIKYEVQLISPHFYFGHGKIMYDENFERYIYSGFSSEELNILRKAEHNLLNS